MRVSTNIANDSGHTVKSPEPIPIGMIYASLRPFPLNLMGQQCNAIIHSGL